MTIPRQPSRKHLLTSKEVALYFRDYHHVSLSPVTIRVWATRKLIKTFGNGRRRYDLREVVAYAIEQEVIPDPKTSAKGAKHGQNH